MKLPPIKDNLIQLSKTIFRTRRRAFALISGIILATMILSGIVLYSSVLQQNAFRSIVGDTDFELKFDKTNNENFDILNEIGSQILSDSEIDGQIDDYTVVAGRFGSNSRTDFDINLQLTKNSDYVNSNDRINAPFRPLFVDERFFTSTIGNSSLNKILYEGEFRLPNVNEIIIPSHVSTEMGLVPGDTIHRLNISLATQIDNQRQLKENSISNITVIGVYEQEVCDLCAFFDNPILEYTNIILNQNALDEIYRDVNGLMLETGNFELLLSIDETKFSVTDPDNFVEELNTLMNTISEKFGDDDIIGTNYIEGAIQGFTFFSIFISVTYVVISIPVIFLSLYVLTYGITVSLEERRKEIAIKKVQGGSASQIFKEIRNETLLIYAIGIILGYILANFVPFILTGSTGFFEFNFGTVSEFISYIEFNLTSLLLSTAVVGLILIFVVNRQGQSFIKEQISSAINSKRETDYGFLRSTNLDIIFFIIGFIGFGISFTEQILRIDLDGGITLVLINIVTPFLIWIGGAFIGSRIVKLVPQFLEPIYLRIYILKDIARMLKAGLRRRGDINKLAIVIVLSLAISSLAVIQGFTDEHQINRDIEYRVGSDYKLTTSTATNITSILNEIEGIQNIQALPTISGRTLSSDISIVGIDPQKEIAALNNQKPILNWHSDTFLSENNQMQNAESALEVLSNSENGIFLSNDLFSVLSKNVGDVVNIAIRLDNPTINSSEIIFQDVEILGIINHMPGGLSGYSLTSQNLLYDFINGSINADDYRKNLISNNEIFASQYQIDMINDNPTVNQILDQKEEFLNITGVTTVSSLNEELNVVQEDGFGFGVTGLLTLAASVSLVATFVSSFAFSSIIMERRKKEFAVLRAIGARKSQIYKMALAENFLMMLIGVIWGTFIGVAVAVIFNGFFSFVTAGILNQLTVDRLIIFPWQDLIIFGTITIVGMMTATVLSIRNSVNADLTVATKDD